MKKSGTPYPGKGNSGGTKSSGSPDDAGDKQSSMASNAPDDERVDGYPNDSGDEQLSGYTYPPNEQPGGYPNHSGDEQSNRYPDQYPAVSDNEQLGGYPNYSGDEQPNNPYQYPIGSDNEQPGGYPNHSGDEQPGGYPNVYGYSNISGDEQQNSYPYRYPIGSDNEQPSGYAYPSGNGQSTNPYQYPAHSGAEKGKEEPQYPLKEIKVESKDIHIIWLGGTIPPEHLNNIYNHNKYARDQGYKINLWVDDAAQKRLSDAMLPGIKVRNVREVNDWMKDEFPPEKYGLLCDCINTERVGNKSLAAASDILRQLILLKEGGIYLDATKPIMKGHDLDYANMTDQARYGFLMVKGLGVGGGINNCLMVASKGHKILDTSIDLMLERYTGNVSTNKTHQENLFDDYRLKKYSSPDQIQALKTMLHSTGSLHDRKRASDPLVSVMNLFHPTPGTSYEGRFSLTLHTTGPGLINDAIKSYVTGEKMPAKLYIAPDYHGISVPDNVMKNFYINSRDCGISITGQQSWLKKSGDHKAPSYGTEELEKAGNEFPGGGKLLAQKDTLSHVERYLERKTAEQQDSQREK